MLTILNPDRALIFRIIHRRNLPWILRNGLHCANAQVSDPSFVSVGDPDLIDKRSRRMLPSPHSGSLSDYIPFYFTPCSPMLFNIVTGWRGIRRQPPDDIIVLVSSLRKLQEKAVPFVFTDRHAYLTAARFFNDTAALDQIDWRLLRRRDFKRDPDDPGKVERYEAEALAYGHVPVDALLGLACVGDSARERIVAEAAASGVSIRIEVRPHWYFR